MLYVLLGCFGVLAGITTVLFGFGGGFFAVPVLYTLLIASHGSTSSIGQSAMQVAVATSTSVMVFSASLATLRHHRAGTLRWDLVSPLLGYIALGASFGAIAAINLEGHWLRWAFIAYLALTIVDALLRPGFVQEAPSLVQPMGRAGSALAGTAIGCLAALLGVGGSVMTVPLMRRRGASMATATAMANPLTLPMALSGTLVYALLAGQGHALGSGYAGYVDLPAFGLLALGSWLGIRLAAPLIGRIPDAVHAKAYLALLAGVLLVMLIVR